MDIRTHTRRTHTDTHTQPALQLLPLHGGAACRLAGVRPPPPTHTRRAQKGCEIDATFRPHSPAYPALGMRAARQRAQAEAVAAARGAAAADDAEASAEAGRRRQARHPTPGGGTEAVARQHEAVITPETAEGLEKLSESIDTICVIAAMLAGTSIAMLAEVAPNTAPAGIEAGGSGGSSPMEVGLIVATAVIAAANLFGVAILTQSSYIEKQLLYKDLGAVLHYRDATKFWRASAMAMVQGSIPVFIATLGAFISRGGRGHWWSVQSMSCGVLLACAGATALGLERQHNCEPARQGMAKHNKQRVIRSRSRSPR